MPLPTVSLDDRRFQDIVDQMKSLIPRYCPEWTDHNVSDPGVALIELFAWMADMLLYRVNQVPDRMYVQFLELIGVRLQPPRAARAAVTFYLSAPQPAPVVLPEGTEVATIRTETSPAIVFTTEAALTLRPPDLAAVLTRNASRPDESAWTPHDLRQLALPGSRFPVFPSQPAPGDALYLGFREDLGHHVLALVLGCETAGGAGIDPERPPYEWQVWQGGASRWAACEVEFDGTGGFNRSGEVILHLPPMTEGRFGGVTAYWLRCRLTDRQATAGYRVSPDLESLRAEARGGTVEARHAITITGEALGRSDGTPAQVYRLLHTPVLARDARRDHLVVELPSGELQRWTEVADFADSRPEDRHFTLDSTDGLLAFGPSLLQPDGTVYQFGAVPEKGAQLRFSRYQHGGGIQGNLPAGALCVIKSSIPYVARVTNRAPAVGGRDAQSLEDAKLRAPQFLRTRTRAVTADDYEYLACEVPGVSRTRCLAPGAQPGEPGEPRPGQVSVVILPHADPAPGPNAPELLALSAELREAVLGHLEERRLLGTTLQVRAPHYVWVAAEVKLRVPEHSDPGLLAETQSRAEEALYRYLSPYTGGPRGQGWPFGRDLHLSELFGLLQRIPGVEFVEEVRLLTGEPGSGSRQPAASRVSVPSHGVVCSLRHTVTVS